MSRHTRRHRNEWYDYYEGRDKVGDVTLTLTNYPHTYTYTNTHTHIRTYSTRQRSRKHRFSLISIKWLTREQSRRRGLPPRREWVSLLFAALDRQRLRWDGWMPRRGAPILCYMCNEYVWEQIRRRRWLCWYPEKNIHNFRETYFIMRGSGSTSVTQVRPMNTIIQEEIPAHSACHIELFCVLMIFLKKCGSCDCLWNR